MMDSIHLQFEYIKDNNYIGDEATLVTRNTMKEYKKDNSNGNYDYIIFSRIVCKNITQFSDYYHRRLVIITEQYPGIKIHLAIQRYTCDKAPYLGIGITYPSIDGNGELMPNDMICMPMPLIQDSLETNIISNVTSNNTLWYDNMDDDLEFEFSSNSSTKSNE